MNDHANANIKKERKAFEDYTKEEALKKKKERVTEFVKCMIQGGFDLYGHLDMDHGYDYAGELVGFACDLYDRIEEIK